MNRYNVDVKYKAYAITSITMEAESEDHAKERIFENLNTDAVEEFEILSIELIAPVASLAPSTSTAQ